MNLPLCSLRGNGGGVPGPVFPQRCSRRECMTGFDATPPGSERPVWRRQLACRSILGDGSAYRCPFSGSLGALPQRLNQIIETMHRFKPVTSRDDIDIALAPETIRATKEHFTAPRMKTQFQ